MGADRLASSNTTSDSGTPAVKCSVAGSPGGLDQHHTSHWKTPAIGTKAIGSVHRRLCRSESTRAKVGKAGYGETHLVQTLTLPLLRSRIIDLAR